MKKEVLLLACAVLGGCSYGSLKRSTASNGTEGLVGSNYYASCADVEAAISCLGQDNCNKNFNGGRLIARELVLTGIANDRLSGNMVTYARQSLEIDANLTKQSCFELPPSPRCGESLYAPEDPPPAPGHSSGLIPPAYHEKHAPESGAYQYKKSSRGERTEKIKFEIPYCE